MRKTALRAVIVAAAAGAVIAVATPANAGVYHDIVIGEKQDKPAAAANR